MRYAVVMFSVRALLEIVPACREHHRVKLLLFSRPFYVTTGKQTIPGPASAHAGRQRQYSSFHGTRRAPIAFLSPHFIIHWCHYIIRMCRSRTHEYSHAQSGGEGTWCHFPTAYQVDENKAGSVSFCVIHEDAGIVVLLLFFIIASCKLVVSHAFTESSITRLGALSRSVQA